LGVEAVPRPAQREAAEAGHPERWEWAPGAEPRFLQADRQGGVRVSLGMVLPRFDYEAPPDMDAALARLAELGRDARVLAGGTDLLVTLKRGTSTPRVLLSLKRVAGLDALDPLDGGGLRLGALATMTALAGHPLLSGRFAGLAEGAASVGGPLIRNRATVGGNIVNGRPCADTVPPLIALGATLHLRGHRGRRVLDLDGFITGPGQTSIRDDEILTSIEIPFAASRRCGSAYLKLTRRAAMEVTIVGCAASVELEDDGRTVSRARIVFASVAPTPVRAEAAERAMEDTTAGEAVLRDAGSLARRAVRPIDDCRAPAAYRSEMVEVLTRRALARALDRAGWRSGS
jgi:CO/xanthine dehydrogenase FAD-binding subunit